MATEDDISSHGVALSCSALSIIQKDSLEEHAGAPDTVLDEQLTTQAPSQVLLPESGIEDSQSVSDEVQFVFSVPRPKKKDGKILEFAQSMVDAPDIKPFTNQPSMSSSLSQSEALPRIINDIGENATSSPFPGNTQVPATSGFTLVPNASNSSSIFYANPADVTENSHASLSPTRTADSMIWWNHSEDSNSGYSNPTRCSQPMFDTQSKKRKWEGETVNMEHGPSSQKHLQQAEAQQIQPRYQLSPRESVSSPNSAPFGGIDTGTVQPSTAEMFTTNPQACSKRPIWETLHTPLLDSPSPWVLEPTSNSIRADQLWPTLPTYPQPSYQTSANSQAFHDPRNDMIEVPVSSVPELSVSPRTKTVMIPRPKLPNMFHYDQPSAQSQSNPVDSEISPLSATVVRGSGSKITEEIQSSWRSAYHRPQTPVPKAMTTLHRPVETSRYDILRKPSLYKVPAWQPNSTIVPVVFPGGTMNSTTPTTPRAPDSTGQERRMYQSPYQHPVSCTPSPVSNPRLPNNHPQQSQQPQKDNPRPAAIPPTHSPNLIVDIAETCQAAFPFALIAKRHNQPVQKVFDTFSAIIQLPLLRNVADNRRHGSLAKRRLKEFRDAKRAMEREMEAEKRRKEELAEKRARRTSVGKGRKKKGQGQGQGLLKTAVLNNARGKDGA